MPSTLGPSVGLSVLHLFFRSGAGVDRVRVAAAVDSARGAGVQVVTIAMLGHKADVAIMALHQDAWLLRDLQTGLAAGGLELVDSYLSVTETSEYATDLPDRMKQARLHPELPPEDRAAWCFYPMSKGRKPDANWFTLPYHKRRELMYEHGTSGRKFAGRILQVVTGSTGLDDFEWGVTLFGQHLDDLKEVVYTLRYDEASALYGEFGVFYTGMVADLEEVLGRTGA